MGGQRRGKSLSVRHRNVPARASEQSSRATAPVDVHRLDCPPGRFPRDGACAPGDTQARARSVTCRNRAQSTASTSCFSGCCARGRAAEQSSAPHHFREAAVGSAHRSRLSSSREAVLYKQPVEGRIITAPVGGRARRARRDIHCLFRKASSGSGSPSTAM